jgi:hypothetical protein
VPKAEIAATRSVELIVQPDAKDIVGKARVRNCLPPRHGIKLKDAVRIVERAEVHIKVLWFQRPISEQRSFQARDVIDHGIGPKTPLTVRVPANSTSHSLEP